MDIEHKPWYERTRCLRCAVYIDCESEEICSHCGSTEIIYCRDCMMAAIHDNSEFVCRKTFNKVAV